MAEGAKRIPSFWWDALIDSRRTRASPSSPPLVFPFPAPPTTPPTTASCCGIPMPGLAGALLSLFVPPSSTGPICGRLNFPLLIHHCS